MAWGLEREAEEGFDRAATLPAELPYPEGAFRVERARSARTGPPGARIAAT
ncbi:hypothetical protein [Streptomyces sp. NPDC060035]|uniref:hypothetical protein n=1 Tax=Streptomyces sp. NPDC060035 TaxID=3347044 RepID=UPI00369A7C4E